MANSATARFSALLFLLFSSLVNITFADPSSPSPAPHSPSSPSPAPNSPSSPSPAPHSQSPATPPDSPSPSPGPATPNSPPTPSPENNPSPSPAPSPDDVGDREVNHSNVPGGDGKSSSGGMSSGKKAGIAFGVIIGAGVVILGTLVYRKRRQNIARSQYGNAARRELL